jgi:hypothetical protein
MDMPAIVRRCPTAPSSSGRSALCHSAVGEPAVDRLRDVIAEKQHAVEAKSSTREVDANSLATLGVAKPTWVHSIRPMMNVITVTYCSRNHLCLIAGFRGNTGRSEA